MQDERVPQHDQKRAVLLRVPTPESPPRLVGPDAAQDGPDEAEKQSEADGPVRHRDEHLRGRRIRARDELPPERVSDREDCADTIE